MNFAGATTDPPNRFKANPSWQSKGFGGTSSIR
jgi:hypothetical protein